MSSPSGQYIRAVSRGSPVFAPVVWSTSDGTPSPLNGMRPPETTRHIRSSGGMMRGPAARKARVRETHATGGRSARGRTIRPSCRAQGNTRAARIRSHHREEDRVPVVRPLAGRARITRAHRAGCAPAVDRARRRGRRGRRRRCIRARASLRPAARVAVSASCRDGRPDDDDRARYRRDRHALREPALHGGGGRGRRSHQRRPVAARHQPRLTRARARRLGQSSDTSPPRARRMPTWPARTPRSSGWRSPAPRSRAAIRRWAPSAGSRSSRSRPV